MQVVFAGICCWVDAKAPRSGKTVIIPNATRGGTRHGSVIPPHSAFIHAKKHQVDSSKWAPKFVVDDNLVFLLEGDQITFDPVPSGGSIDIRDLPHVRVRVTKEPICPAADELRHGFRDDPTAFNVLGLVDVPPDAPISTSSNGNGAMFATMRMPDGPLTIMAKPFDSAMRQRTLQVIDPSASVFIANVTMIDYLLGQRAPDDDHQYLVCEMFKPHSKPNATASHETSALVMKTELSERETNSVDEAAIANVQATAGKIMQDFLCTFAAGCSDSQWP